jgi:cell division protein FtsW (lipid II flippase)
MRRAGVRITGLDWSLVAVVLLISLLGVYNLHSAAAAREPDLYATQLGIFGFSALVAAALVVFDYRITEGLAYPVYAVACLLLVAVLVQGKAAGGAQRWLELGPATFQPSEPAKLAVILCLARYFSHRIDPNGYSMRRLFRPLNPSRPLAGLVALVLLWDKPFLADPGGELARLVRRKVGADIPAAGDLAWFRLFLVVSLLVALGGGIAWIVRFARQRELLDPWPRGQRNRIIALWTALCLALAGGLASLWNAPFVRDPFGEAIARLAAAAGPGGAYAILEPGMALRLALILALLAYAVASALALRRGVEQMVDVIIAPIDLLAIPAILILVEPDLGTAGIIILVGFTMILVVGVRLRTLIILGAMGAMIAVSGWFGILKDYQKRRILTFIDPEHDLKGAGWNAVQSMIAVGSGRWTGKGHMEGTQTQLSFLPEQHTDFAFSVWAEEQGFIGCLLLLGLYFLLLAFALAIAAEAREAYGSLLATGIAAMILWQAVINIGMVIGVLPVVGMTLPLFSYGGSSLLTVMVGVGLLLNVHLRRRAH